MSKVVISCMLGSMVFVALPVGAAKPQPTKKPVNQPVYKSVTLENDTIKKLSGQWMYYPSSTISIGGLVYDGYATLRNSKNVTFDIRGWERFQALVGVGELGSQTSLSIKVDGEEVQSILKRSGEKSELIDIPLKGKQTLTLIASDYYIYFMKPKLSKGTPSGAFKGELPVASEGPDDSPVSRPTWSVDPRDLERLAENLGKRIKGNARVLNLMADGDVALSTFTLIDIPWPSMSESVAEDLYTSLINNEFNLVERGQLDKVMKELNIRSIGSVDPKTAQKVGQQSGCKFILLGSIADKGTFVAVNIRLMETATGKSLVAERVEARKIPLSPPSE